MVVVFVVGLAIDASGGLIGRPVNRNDAAHLVDYYERLRKNGLPGPTAPSAISWTGRPKHARDEPSMPSCTAAGGAGTVLLWGDSFAQALSLGFREHCRSVALAQVATSGCKAAIENFDLDGEPAAMRNRRTCSRWRPSIGLRPELVIIAQCGGHDAVDWPRLTSRALELGALHVLMVGPFPLWRPSLPRVLADHYLQDRAPYVRTGLDRDQFRCRSCGGGQGGEARQRDICVIARSTCVKTRRALRGCPEGPISI